MKHLETIAKIWSAIAPFSSIIVPIFVAVLSGHFFARKKSKEDNVDKRMDELCAEIAKLGEAAQEYWSSEVAERASKGMPLRVTVHWTRVNGLRVLLEEFVSNSAREEILEADGILFKVSTGGDFGGASTAVEPERGRLCLLEAANYVNVVRSARMLDMKGWFRRK